MKRAVLAVVLLISGVTLGAAAVTYAFVVDRDYELPASPCGGVQTIQATPITFDSGLWVQYLCADSRVFLRRFDTAVMLPPTQIPIVCPQGFVHTGDQQGCVPPNHPLAGRDH